MLEKEDLDEIQQLLENITSVPINSLITNPNWGTINFELSRADLELIYSLCNHLKTLPLSLIPPSIAENFKVYITRAGQSIQKIKEFNIETGNPTGNRDTITAELASHAEALLVATKDWIPFLAYQKGDIQRNIDDLIKATTAANKLLSDAVVDVETKKVELGGIVRAARDASASAGVGVFTEDFKDLASGLDRAAGTWLKWTLGLAVGTLVVAFASFFLPVSRDATNAQAFQFLTSKLIVFIVLITATVWCGRIYKALKHQVTINNHRASALKTFQAFVKAASDEPTRNAVLLETTRSIFNASHSGYLDSSDSSTDANTRVFEIMKSTIESTAK